MSENQEEETGKVESERKSPRRRITPPNGTKRTRCVEKRSMRFTGH